MDAACTRRVKDALGYAATSATITGLTNGTTYYFMVKAKGDGDVYSPASNDIGCKPTSWLAP
ncbi:MAG: fibronectin type III domain-containing protein [Peptococcaceae bacterium]|nr:fibronectin type III domain-containing protein [Peptococcaceae bacterium]